MKQVSRKSIMTGAVFVGAAAIASFALLAEGLMHPKGEDMAQSQKAQKISDDDALRAVRDSFKRYDFQNASDIVFGMIQKSISMPCRYTIMAEYSKRYPAQALDRIKTEALELGRTYEDLKTFETRSPSRYGYMKALSYGIALFGENGMKASVDLILSGAEVRDPYGRNPLAHTMGMTSAGLIMKNRQMKPERALELLGAQVMNPNVDPNEKDAFMRIGFDIDPNVACRWRASAPDDGTRAQLNNHIQTTLKGKVGCS